MSKVIMGNGSFYGCSIESQGLSVWWKETAQKSVFLLSRSFLLSPIKANKTLTTHNANRHCRVNFYTFSGQPLSKTWILGSGFLAFIETFMHMKKLLDYSDSSAKKVMVERLQKDAR